MTPFQVARIKFHFDAFARGLLELHYDVSLTALDTENQLLVIGDLENSLEAEKIILHGQELCTISSLLGQVELAYNNLSPELISDSLLVKKAGTVQLRGDELLARTKLYKQHLGYLAHVLGFTSTPTSIGGGGRVNIF